ncbi:MAG: HAMP domain-containing sensor histidine kinase [Bacteroidota bacterium]
MKKPGVLFAFVSVYIVAAFTWWTVLHIRSSRNIHALEISELELLPYKATFDVQNAVEQEMFRDTNDLKNYFYINYPTLEIVFHQPEEDVFDPLHNYAIVPKRDIVNAIEDKYTRRFWMYGLEGVVMMGLLFWGIIWIYRSLQSRINLKKQQSNFLLSITHELKTPLASIKLYLETLIKRPNLERHQSETMIKNSINDVERLRDLVDNLLMAAQLDNHKFNLVFVDANLSDLLKVTAEKYMTPRNLQDRFILDIEPGIMARVDAFAMEMVLNNLLSNAFKYSPADKPVGIVLKTEGQQIKIRIIDEGKGISAEDKKSLFDKFYRAEDENVRKSKGTGLGLFIVKTLVNLHGGSVVVTDNVPSGVIFELTLQKNAA